MGGAYQSYRTSKMQWLPPVPEHWDEQRAKVFFREVDERSRTGEEELLSVSHLTGVTPRSQKNVTMFKAASYVGSKLCSPGDIVINTLWAWMAALGASRNVGIVSPAYGVYRPHHADSFNPAYLDYLLRTRAYVAEYIGRSTGIRSSRLRLYPNQFLDIALIQPPRTEQDQMVAYLRAQDAHIARFIKAKRDLIGLLTEQKLRIIDHAVTRGIDASVALKPSGIDWLGDVPGHWDVMPLKRACVRSALYGANIPATHYTDTGVRFLRTTDILESGRLKTGGVFLPDVMVRNYLLSEGDVLLSRSGTIGRSFLYRSEKHGQCSYAGYLVRFSPSEVLLPEFLFCYTKTRAFADFIKLNAISTTIENLNGDKYAKMAVPVPPLAEQQAICQWITDECQPLEETIARAEDEIKLIREYRDRQIADVVTGQVDVRGWVSGPDDVVAEEDLAALGGDEEIDTDGEEDNGDE